MVESQKSTVQAGVATAKKQIEEYHFIKQVGEGSFGSVYLARDLLANKLVAVKTLEKAHIVKFDKTKSVYREKDILQKFASHPNVINLDCVFQVGIQSSDTLFHRISKISTLFLSTVLSGR
jgi:serine/threonine protein kinase